MSPRCEFAKQLIVAAEMIYCSGCNTIRICHYVERAILEYKLKNWPEVSKYCKEALKIVNHEKSYINETFSWDHTILDLLSISNFYQNNLKDALFFSNKALEISPNNERLMQNNKIIQDTIKNISN